MPQTFVTVLQRPFFKVAFLAMLFLVHAWQAMRSSGKQEQEDRTLSDEWGRLIGPLARGGGNPFLLQVPSSAESVAMAYLPGLVAMFRRMLEKRSTPIGCPWMLLRAAGGTGTLDDCQHLLS